MKEFTILINNRDPRIILQLLEKNYTPHLSGPARFVHKLITFQWALIAGLKGKGQTIKYGATLKTIDETKIFNESLVLFNGSESDTCLISIVSENKSQPKDLSRSEKKDAFYGSDLTSVSIVNTLLGNHNYNVCMPGQNEVVCKLLLIVIDGLKSSHLFNLCVVENTSLVFKAMSVHDDTVVEIKTNSWIGVSIDQFNSELKHYDNYRSKVIH